MENASRETIAIIEQKLLEKAKNTYCNKLRAALENLEYAYNAGVDETKMTDIEAGDYLTWYNNAIDIRTHIKGTKLYFNHDFEKYELPNALKKHLLRQAVDIFLSQIDNAKLIVDGLSDGIL